SINILKLEVKLRDTTLVENKKKLEKEEKERDELKLTLEKFQNSSKSLNNLLESQVIDKFKTGLGYNATSSAVESFVNSSEMLENQENNKSKSDKGYHAVPLPFIGNFMPHKPNLMFMDEIVESENLDVTTVVTPSNVKAVESNHESAKVKNNGDAVEPKTVRKNNFRPPVIEDWNSDDESEVEIIPKDKTISSSIEKIKLVMLARETVEKGNPQQKDYKEKGVIDSGCSRHITRNKCYLTEYEDYDGGFVSFRDDKGRISRKVEETLNIRFLENAPNVTGNGPDWLFDVDSLTISMNYVPVVAGNQTNGITKTRDNIVAGQAEKKTKPEQEYILIPFCTTDPLISQGPKDSEEDVGMKPTKVNESGASDKGEEDEQDTRIDAAKPSSTNDTPSSPVNAAKTSEEHLFEHFSPFKNAFTLPNVPNVSLMDDNTRIFAGAYCELHRRRSRSRGRSRSRSRRRSRIKEVEEAEEEANHIKLNCFCSDEYPFRGTCKESATSSHICTYFTH
ncbi:hypothetical protein Tco_0382798, partial [Tanacetum coccineum]